MQGAFPNLEVGVFGKLRPLLSRLQSGFPKDTGSTCIGPGGFINYKRRSLKDYRDNPTRDLHGTTATWTQGGDEFIVPYNPWVLLWTKTHVNIEIAATVNVIAYLYKYGGGDFACTYFGSTRTDSCGLQVHF